MSVHRAVAILVGPWRDRTREDALRMAQAKKVLLDAGWVPIFLPDALGDVLDESVLADRGRGLGCSQSLIMCLAKAPGVVGMFRVPADEGEGVDEGENTEGMRLDLAAWAKAAQHRPIGTRLPIVVPLPHCKAAVTAMVETREAYELLHRSPVPR